MTESRRRRLRAAEGWRELGDSARQEWREFATKHRRYSPEKQRIVAPTPRSLFMKAAIDRWWLDDDLDLPTQPPLTVFDGDALGVVAYPNPKRRGAPSGCLRVEATGRNRGGMLTAICLQKLAGPFRKPVLRRLRPVAYVSFNRSVTHVDLPVEPGFYATAYRFVDARTLQVGPIILAGIVAVGVKAKKRRLKPQADQTITTAVIDTARS